MPEISGLYREGRMKPSREKGFVERKINEEQDFVALNFQMNCSFFFS